MHATPSTYEAQLRADCEAIAAQGWLKFLVPWGPGRVRVTASEAAAALGYKSVSTLYEELDRPTTWLECGRRVGTDLQQVWITARSVELQMAREALEGGMVKLRQGKVMAPLFLERLKELVRSLDRFQAAELMTELQKLKAPR